MPKSKLNLNIKPFLILIVAFIIRFYGMNWDNGFHLHPDERMILMVANQIHFFDKLNPHFFNYGSLPIYLLKSIAQAIDLFFASTIATYQGLLNLGRTLSVIFDVATTFIIYRIASHLFKKKEVGYFASFFYAITFFSIQNSHFFTVDIMFTFLSTLLFYRLLHFTRDRPHKSVLTMSIVFAALFATKFTALVFYPIILFVIIIGLWRKWKKCIIFLFIFHFSFLIFTFLFMPYAFLDFSQFVHDISLQLVMNRNAYIFPYTLQYVNTLPYWYYLKNIFLWGLGPVISILAILGLEFSIFSRSNRDSIKSKFINIKFSKFISNFPYWINEFQIFLLFYFFYFFVIGISAVKFMRYMLPLYPFLTILAGLGFYSIQQQWYKIYPRSLTFLILFRTCILLFLSIWSILFISIYAQPNTRVAATEWILKNIPAGSSLAVEYWDDYLPIYGSERYHFNELHLYDLPDDDKKWNILVKQLETSDYIIIASNRLYTPLQKLANYPNTAEYYQKLFKGELNFKKIAEFSVYPGIQFGPITLQINDQSADESFTVYDHPKVMIFKRI